MLPFLHRQSAPTRVGSCYPVPLLSEAKAQFAFTSRVVRGAAPSIGTTSTSPPGRIFGNHDSARRPGSAGFLRAKNWLGQEAGAALVFVFPLCRHLSSARRRLQ